MALIVELFGPPGSGKTTFAKALARRLQTLGVDAQAHLSARPGEDERGRPSAAPIGRVMRPVWQLASSALARDSRRPTGAAIILSDRFGRLKQLRMSQYLFRLAAAWTQAEARPGVAIFDQAYLQFVATVFAQAKDSSKAEIGEALGSVPQSDLALRLDTEAGTLEQRLQARLDNVGVVGRLLERGAGSSENYLSVCVSLQEELESRNRFVLTTRSAANSGFFEEIEGAARVVARICGQREGRANLRSVS